MVLVTSIDSILLLPVRLRISQHGSEGAYRVCYRSPIGPRNFFILNESGTERFAGDGAMLKPVPEKPEMKTKDRAVSSTVHWPF
jgi:hypothetical protein